MFSVFIYRNFEYCKPGGYSGFMTPYVWMFIKSYEQLRDLIIKQKTITTLIQFEYSAFEEATVPICSFVLCNEKAKGVGCYFRLSEFTGGMKVQREKIVEAINNQDCGYFFEAKQENFLKIPGAPFAYWVNDNFLSAFEGKKIKDYGDANNGFTTGDNNLFLRLWEEVALNKLCFNAKSMHDAEISMKKWFPYNKGGAYRKWYGNNDYVINWLADGKDIKNYGHLVPRSMKYQFRKSISWSKISSSVSSFKVKSEGTMFDVAGLSLFPFDDENYYYLLALCNSCFAQKCLDFLSPTLNYETGHIASIPVKIDYQLKNKIDSLSKENVEISKKDWDSFETSWGFERHPFVVSKGNLLRIEYENWAAECELRFNKLKQNEEELNKLFIEIYGLQSELSPDVNTKEVSIRHADLNRDIRSFISYAVGCILGRYSLDQSGIAYAGGTWDSSRYQTFQADKDGIVPICDDEYFDDDITGLFIKFVETIYGKDTLEENLQFIADVLGGSGTSREIIRNYFLNDFYVDHCSTYSVPGSGKRPIYWLFDSGKKNGFKCLIYMHRYQPDTIARIRTDYVHEQQSRYRTAIADLEQRIESASTSDRVKLNKKLKHLQEQSAEIHDYEEKIHHLADQYISIDLDDGVKVNYAKFQDVLAKIK